MKCPVCQYDLPAGSTFCTNCGTPLSANSYGNQASPSSPNQGIAPTMLASSPSPDPYGQPSNPYGQPSSPYGQPSSPYTAPPTPYGAPPPANPYGSVPSTDYGTPPPPANPYGAPPQPAYDPNAGNFGVPPYGQQPQFVPQQPKKGPSGCVIAAIIVITLFVLIVGGVVAAVAVAANKVSQTVNNSLTSINATSTADMATANAFETPTVGNTESTPTTDTSGAVPTSSQIDANAAANITSAHTSHGVDGNYKPTHITSTFTSGQTIDITVTFSGKAGYAMVKIYLDGSFDTQSDSPLTVKSGYAYGDFPFTPIHTGSFVSGLYWCEQADCSDAALAQVVSFTVS